MINKNIKNLRKKIDNIDNQLLQLILKRSKVVEKIGKNKSTSKKIIDLNRENKILDRLIKLHNGKYPKDSIIRLWREIFFSSVKLQIRNKEILQPKRNINSIKIYKGGLSKILGKRKIIKLSSNESPFSPSKKAMNSYKKTSLILSRYPELTAESLQIEIGKKFKLNPEQIICGTGSDEVLIFCALAFCSPGDEIIHAQHGFEMYPIITKYTGAESVIASEIDYKVSIDSILDNISQATKLIFIANPNNPTGTYLKKSELEYLIRKVPKNIIVVIDAAYAEFADAKDYDKSFKFADKYKNVLITRTFSKAYSLAGLRLGWGYASKELILILKKLRPPFNITPGAISAGIEALKDNKHLKKVVKHNNDIKNWLINELNKFGFKAYKTQSNFVFVLIPEKKGQSASLINEYLISKGIAVRYLKSYGIENGLRITIGKKNELKKLILALNKFNKK